MEKSEIDRIKKEALKLGEERGTLNSFVFLSGLINYN